MASFTQQYKQTRAREIRDGRCCGRKITSTSSWLFLIFPVAFLAVVIILAFFLARRSRGECLTFLFGSISDPPCAAPAATSEVSQLASILYTNTYLQEEQYYLPKKWSNESGHDEHVLVAVVKMLQVHVVRRHCTTNCPWKKRWCTDNHKSNISTQHRGNADNDVVKERCQPLGK